MSTWHEEWAGDPSALKNWFRAKRGQADAARDAGDDSAVHRYALELAEAAPYLTEEPMASEYDRALIQLLNKEAQIRLNVVDFAGAIRCLEHARALLEAMSRRQAAMGRPPWPCSVEWQLLLIWLADAKWKGPKSTRDAVMLPLEMIERSELLEERVLRHLRENPTTPENSAAHMQNIAWCGVKQLDMAVRYCPAHLPGMKKRFNDRNDGLLDDKSMPFYWDFRIAEGWWEGTASSKELTMLFAQRRVALRRFQGPVGYLADFDRSSDAELKYLKLHPASKLKRTLTASRSTTPGH